MEIDTQPSIKSWGIDSATETHYTDSIIDWDQVGKNLFIKTSSLTLVIDEVQLIGKALKIKISCFHLNSTSLQIPKVYHSDIRKLMNVSSEINYSLVFSEIQNTPMIYCVFPNSFQSISQFKQKLKIMLREVVNKLNECLQFSGSSKKTNWVGMSLKCKYLSLKRKVIDTLRKGENETDGSTIFEKNQNQSESIIKKVFSIQEIQKNQNNQKIKNGGYFQVYGNNCKIKVSENALVSTTSYLAVKKPRNEQNISPQSFIEKLSKQLSAVRKIKNKNFLATYYQCQSNSQVLYMEYLPYNLKDIVYCKSLSFTEIISISKQLVQSVKNLHDSGIVHRDLKPENTLIEVKDQKINLKLIDFGQSYIDQETGLDAKLGCTLPYSAPQCRASSVNGLNRQQIDLWSVLMIIYEITFKSLPISFTRIIGKDIIDSWKDPEKFSVFPNLKKFSGIRSAQQVISILTLIGLKIDQKQRPSLATIYSVIKLLQSFQKQCYQLISSRFD